MGSSWPAQTWEEEDSVPARVGEADAGEKARIAAGAMAVAGEKECVGGVADSLQLWETGFEAEGNKTVSGLPEGTSEAAHAAAEELPTKPRRAEEDNSAAPTW